MRLHMTILAACCAVSLLTGSAGAEDQHVIKLVPPNLEASQPLMAALKDRKSMREFGERELPEQVLSDLLWAAGGINRPETGGRTSPTAMDCKEIDIYVARADGLYLYDAQGHELKRIISGDIRTLTGKQDFAAKAPLNLIFVADMSRMSRIDKYEREFYAACDTGYISQNVYLFCAAGGLNTVARGWVDKVALSAAMKLRKDQRIILAQTVGYPRQ